MREPDDLEDLETEPRPRADYERPVQFSLKTAFVLMVVVSAYSGLLVWNYKYTLMITAMLFANVLCGYGWWGWVKEAKGFTGWIGHAIFFCVCIPLAIATIAFALRLR